jgi:hypothetical protein
MTENLSRAREIVNRFIGYQADLPSGREINLNRRQAVQVARFYCMDQNKWPDDLKNFYAYQVRDGRTPVSTDNSVDIIARFVASQITQKANNV